MITASLYKAVNEIDFFSISSCLQSPLASRYKKKKQQWLALFQLLLRQGKLKKR